MPKTTEQYYFIEHTDMYQGEANYCWVNRFIVSASSERGAMRKVAKKGNLMPPEDLFEICLEMGVNIWPCQMTMDLLGIKPEQMRPNLGEPVGAATALQVMSKSNISLFI